MAADTQSARDEEVGLDSVAIVLDLRVDRVVELYLEVVAVVDGNATIDQIFCK